MNKKSNDANCHMPINVNLMLLSPKTKIWLINAQVDEISKILEMGYMVNYTINKDSINNEIIATSTIESNKTLHDIKQLMLSNHDDQLNNINNIISTNLNNFMNKTLELKNNNKSSDIGKEGEQEAYDIIKNHFDDITDMHDKAHNGDYVIHDTLLVEIKNYSRTVPTKEVDKFKKDLQTTGKLGGIFWSLNSPIAHIGDMKHTSHTINGKEIPVIYLNTKNKDLIILSIKLILMEINTKYPNHKNTHNPIDITHLTRTIEFIKTKIISLEQNMNTILSIRNIICKLSEQFNDSINSMLLELTTLEGTSKTNIALILQELN